MTTEFARQYKCSCVVLDGTEDPDDVLDQAIAAGAVYEEHDESGTEDQLCLRFPGRPQELFTERAMRAFYKPKLPA